MKRRIYKPQCRDCKFYLKHEGPVAQKVKGILLKPGERYCTGAKKIRKFKPGDPKVFVPSWCPRHIYPAELRIYCYKNLNTAVLRNLLRTDGLRPSPSGYEYALRYRGSTRISARDLQKRLDEEYLWQILDVEVHNNEVIEINDGLMPYFFCVAEAKVECVYFDRENALQNVLEPWQ